MCIRDSTKNAATVAQNAYTDAMQKHLSDKSRNHIANFADDFIGGADTIEELLEIFEDFINMCAKAGITLNPEKVRFGHTTETFYGHNLTNGKIEPSDKNLSPVKKMQAPQCDSDLLSIMGVFDQFQPFIKGYGLAKSPASIIRGARTHKDPPVSYTHLTLPTIYSV